MSSYITHVGKNPVDLYITAVRANDPTRRTRIRPTEVTVHYTPLTGEVELRNGPSFFLVENMANIRDLGGNPYPGANLGAQFGNLVSNLLD